MDSQALSAAHEENHALWWTIDGLAQGQKRDGTGKYYWTLLPDERWASLHKIRFSEKGSGSDLDSLVRKAVKHRSAIHAHASDLSTPEDIVALMRARGFQHMRRYPVLAEAVSRLKEPARPAKVEVHEVTDFDAFGASDPHPSFGAVSTKDQKRGLAQIKSRVNASQGAIRHFLVSKGLRHVGCFTLVFSNDVCGLYDVVFDSKAQTAAHYDAVLAATLQEAKAEGAEGVVMIKDREEEAFFRSRGFRDVGWLSWLYLSKTKVDALALP